MESASDGTNPGRWRSCQRPGAVGTRAFRRPRHPIATGHGRSPDLRAPGTPVLALRLRLAQQRKNHARSRDLLKGRVGELVAVPRIRFHGALANPFLGGLLGGSDLDGTRPRDQSLVDRRTVHVGDGQSRQSNQDRRSPDPRPGPARITQRTSSECLRGSALPFGRLCWPHAVRALNHRLFAG